jgi:ribonuclease HII
MLQQKGNKMEVVVKFNSSKNRFEGFVDGKMLSRSRHESYVKDQLAKQGFFPGTVETNKTEAVSEFGINERFEFVEKMVSMVAKKTIASAIITGQGGLGKTHTVLKSLKAQNLLDTTDLTQFEIGAKIPTARAFRLIKGFSTAKGLYRTLFEGNGQVLVFDDCDSVLTDPTALNLLKGALDSYGDRWISWNADMRDEDLPRTFKFTGTIIFISNKDLERLDQAVRSRAMCVDLSMTQAQKIERMEVLVADPEFLEEYSKGFKQDAIDFLRENMNSIKNLSLRTLIATTKIRAEGGAWKNLAKYVITQGA